MKPALLALILLAPLNAGEVNPAEISPKASWWLHSDLEAGRETTIGSRMVTEIEARMANKLQAVQRMFAVNPLTDLDAITLFGDGGKHRAVALIRGRFDQAHLEDIVRGNDTYDSSDHAGITIHHWQDKGRKQFAAFPSEGLLVFSHQQELVHEAVNVQQSPSSQTLEPYITNTRGRLVISGRAFMQKIDMKGGDSRLLKKADSMVITLAEDGDHMVAGTQVVMPNQELGGRLLKVIDGMVALGQLGNERFESLGIEHSSQTEGDGKTVTSTLRFPSQAMLDLMEKEGMFDKIGR